MVGLLARGYLPMVAWSPSMITAATERRLELAQAAGKINSETIDGANTTADFGRLATQNTASPMEAGYVEAGVSAMII